MTKLLIMLWPNAETALNKVEKSSLLHAYEVNAVGPILVIKVNLTLNAIPKVYNISFHFSVRNVGLFRSISDIAVVSAFL